MLGIICAMAVEVEGILGLMENKEEIKKAGASSTCFFIIPQEMR